ncbi:uncharacterized protein YbjT (DUF2867 family) [Inhella inkyongensis]|uniref:Uncharacterized protein YbjT (DUF2867 family) n=1 Tax=Inhella inkyongensis TaxID=392593 RepID=A0A840S1H2_9BURK|nr:NAD-dependent epimerase/dehydratase family protein [Inhella inkyongensis]MBB5203372.1 uncharacterized protein YbjT (DUF2867 family) [Inhella inkyongensis]
MHVLLIGAGGFIGQHAHRALAAAGHRVHTLKQSGPPALDWSAAHRPQAWFALLSGMDAAIYLPGTLRDRQGGQHGLLERLHHHVPKALAQACVAQGVPRLLHVSALCGADSAYGRSKRAGEAALAEIAACNPLTLHVLRPSVVMGSGGVSSRQFEFLSRLPWLALPAALWHCQIQPLHIEDLCEALLACLLAPSTEQPWQLVGAQVHTVAGWIAQLRAASGRAPARVFRLPDGLARWSARVGDYWPGSSWCREALSLLQSDSVATDPQQLSRLTALLGHPPRDARLRRPQ